MTTAAAPRRRAARRLGLDRFEIAVALALFGLSMAILTGLLVRIWTKGGVLTGSDGFLVVDQLQYLGWLRQAGEHLLIENLYDLEEGPRYFLHPGLAISGGLHRLGLGLMASYAIWKPIAVGALFTGVLLLTRRMLERRDDRRLALVLCLFATTPVAAIVGWSGLAGAQRRYELDFMSNEMWAGTWLWGYMFTAVAVATMPLALLAYERGRGADGTRRMLVWAGVAAAICSWLQPWQGAALILVLAGAEAIATRRERRPLLAAARDLAIPLALATAPLVYYLVLGMVDESWELAADANNVFPRWPWWLTVLGLAPLALPAAFAYRLPAPSFADVALRLWPFAALAVYLQPTGTFPFHAFQGLTIPLALLGVIALRAWLRERPLPVVPAIAVAAFLIVTPTAYNADHMLDAINTGFQAHFMEPEEHDALRHLDAEPEPGGVISNTYLGTAVPAYTGRETYIGAGSWTPDFERRNLEVEALFRGRLSPARAEALIRRSGARFVFQDCHGRADVSRILAGFTDPPRRFGCATVWRVRDA